MVIVVWKPVVLGIHPQEAYERDCWTAIFCRETSYINPNRQATKPPGETSNTIDLSTFLLLKCLLHLDAFWNPFSFSKFLGNYPGLWFFLSSPGTWNGFGGLQVPHSSSTFWMPSRRSFTENYSKSLWTLLGTDLLCDELLCLARCMLIYSAFWSSPV